MISKNKKPYEPSETNASVVLYNVIKDLRQKQDSTKKVIFQCHVIIASSILLSIFIEFFYFSQRGNKIQNFLIDLIVPTIAYIVSLKFDKKRELYFIIEKYFIDVDDMWFRGTGLGLDMKRNEIFQGIYYQLSNRGMEVDSMAEMCFPIFHLMEDTKEKLNEDLKQSIRKFFDQKCQIKKLRSEFNKIVKAELNVINIKEIIEE